MRTFNSARRWVVAAAAVSAVLGVGCPAVAAPSAVPDSPARQTLKEPTVVGQECAGSKGVTVVVDFRNLHNEAGKVMNKVKIGCATGAQEDGLAALIDAGFDVDPTSALVCQIDDRPLPADSMCTSAGYWSYWHAERDGRWTYSDVGPADWEPAPGTLEGWSWSPYDKDWGAPRVKPAELFG